MATASNVIHLLWRRLSYVDAFMFAHSARECYTHRYTANTIVYQNPLCAWGRRVGFVYAAEQYSIVVCRQRA